MRLLTDAIGVRPNQRQPSLCSSKRTTIAPVDRKTLTIEWGGPCKQVESETTQTGYEMAISDRVRDRGTNAA